MGSNRQTPARMLQIARGPSARSRRLRGRATEDYRRSQRTERFASTPASCESSGRWQSGWSAAKSRNSLAVRPVPDCAALHPGYACGNLAKSPSNLPWRLSAAVRWFQNWSTCDWIDRGIALTRTIASFVCARFFDEVAMPVELACRVQLP
jgi:hypothetical protein